MRYKFRGACPCSVNHTCEDPNQTCNCDIKEGKWFSDDGYYSSAQSLGITNMYFLQQKELDEEAKGRITLGPLECVETSKLIKFVLNFLLNNFLCRYTKICCNIYNISILY